MILLSKHENTPSLWFLNSEGFCFVKRSIWQLKVGSPWRDLPTEFGSWKTVYSRFRKWTDSGLFEQIFKIICEDDDPDMENVSLDSTTIRVHQKGTGAQKNPAAQ